MDKTLVIISLDTLKKIDEFDKNGFFFETAARNQCEIAVWSLNKKEFNDAAAFLKKPAICDLLVLRRFFAKKSDLLDCITNGVIIREHTVIIGTSDTDCILSDILDAECLMPDFILDHDSIQRFRDKHDKVRHANMKFLLNNVFPTPFKDIRELVAKQLTNDRVLGINSDLKIPTDPFIGDNIFLERVEIVIDKVSNCKVTHVRSPLMLIQALDRVKFLLKKEHKKVFYRGQGMLYPKGLVPSAYRHLTTNPTDRAKAKSEIDRRIDALITTFKKTTPKKHRGAKLFKGKKDGVIEGLFQQYEHSSRWIDAVDNIWIALWFACHRRWECDDVVQYRRRDPNVENNDHRYAYILVLAVNDNRNSKETKFIDLREETDSQFIRPHIQHGILLQSLRSDGTPSDDMSSLIYGVVRIDLQMALDWLGTSPLFDPTTIFPSPSFDGGLREMNKRAQTVNEKNKKRSKKKNMNSKTTKKENAEDQKPLRFR